MGVGSYGEVRYGYHEPSGSHVAVKLLQLQLSGSSSAEVRRLHAHERAMMRAAQQSRHTARLVELDHDSGQHSGHWCSQCACTGSQLPSAASSLSSPPSSSCPQCQHPSCSHSSSSSSRPVLLLAQELYAGGELFSLLSHTGPLPEPLARFYFHQLLLGVSELHALHVVHRDLKPENLLLDHHFDLRIVDFGLATRRKPPRMQSAAQAEDGGDAGEGEEVDDDDDDSFDWAMAARVQQAALASAALLHDPHDDGTCTHLTGVGSQPYSAPEAYYRELYSHRPYRGAPADLWSCGVILYVLLTGQPPFLRPLTRTYGALKRDPHFIALMKGDYDARIGAEARELLQNLLRVHPDDRWSVEQVQRSSWWRGAVMEREQVEREMRRRAELTFHLMDRPHQLHLLQHLRKEDHIGEEAAPSAEQAVQQPQPQPQPQPAHPLHSKDGDDIDASTLIHRSSPITIHPSSSRQPPSPPPPASFRPQPPAYLQPLCSLPDSSFPVLGEQLPSSFDSASLSTALAALQLSTLPGSPSLSSASSTVVHTTALSSSSRMRSSSYHSQHQHTSTLPSPVHHRHQQQEQQPLPPAAARAAAHVPSSPSTAHAGARSPPLPPSADAAYRSYASFFRSGRPPVTPPLSLSAQSQLKPTAWPRRDSHSRSHSRSARGRGVDAADAEEREEGGEDGEEDSDNDDGDTDAEEEGVEDVDAGYENDSDTSSEEPGREDGAAARPTGKGEEKHEP